MLAAQAATNPAAWALLPVLVVGIVLGRWSKAMRAMAQLHADVRGGGGGTAAAQGGSVNNNVIVGSVLDGSGADLFELRPGGYVVSLATTAAGPGEAQALPGGSALPVLDDALPAAALGAVHADVD